MCTVACELSELLPCSEEPSLLGRLWGKIDVVPNVPSSGSSRSWEEREVLSQISSDLSLGGRLTGKSHPPPDLERHEPLPLSSILVVW